MIPFATIRNEEEYDVAIARMNELLDEVGSDEQHPLYDLLDTLGTVILAYEERHYPIPECTGIDALEFLMEEHELGVADIPEIGGPDSVSNVLERKRELTVQNIRDLANRFQVSPAVFV
ncbi:MAG: transcriptional regulator [Chloroflexi bacterium]|nr:transcriptional regulator [Chloroflexota bacterium]